MRLSSASSKCLIDLNKNFDNNFLSSNIQIKNIFLKRNFIFINDFKYFFKYFCLFLKRVRKLIWTFKTYLITENSDTNIQDLRGIKRFKFHFFFIAESTDPFFFNLFSGLALQNKQLAFFIAWHPIKFFFFLRRIKSRALNFFPIIVIAPSLYFNLEFMHVLKSFRMFPILFFFDRQLSSCSQILSYKNVFSVFFNRKNNLKFLLLFFKFFVKIF